MSELLLYFCSFFRNLRNEIGKMIHSIIWDHFITVSAQISLLLWCSQTIGFNLYQPMRNNMLLRATIRASHSQTPISIHVIQNSILFKHFHRYRRCASKGRADNLDVFTVHNGGGTFVTSIRYSLLWHKNKTKKKCRMVLRIWMYLYIRVYVPIYYSFTYTISSSAHEISTEKKGE